MIRENHVYVGSSDKALEWSGFKAENETSEASETEIAKLVTQVRERFKNYLQLDHVNFLFGTGSSIHLGAAGIQSIPRQVEKDIDGSEDDDLKADFKQAIQVLQKPLVEMFNPEVDTLFENENKWRLISDGVFIRALPVITW